MNPPPLSPGLVIGLSIAYLAGFSVLNAQETPANLKTENLVAWCIVPFDANKRSPAERAAMLKRLGLRRSAYDWREEHVPQFEEEIIEYKQHGIEYFAFWGFHDKALQLFKKHKLHPQLWLSLGSPTEGSQSEKVEAATKSMEAFAKRASDHGCKLGLYNHGGWGGKPQNLVAVCKKLREKGYKNVGIVYNWHHGHDHIGDWAKSFALMKPHLLCLNINGMNSKAKPKILSLGQGEHDLAMLKVLVKSGYDGPVGILDHQSELDTEKVLRENLAGLERLRKHISELGIGNKQGRPNRSRKETLRAAPVTSPAKTPHRALRIRNHKHPDHDWLWDLRHSKSGFGDPPQIDAEFPRDQNPPHKYE